MSACSPGLKFNKQERIRQSHQFRQIYTGGQKINGPHLTIFYRPNQLDFNRLGLAVAKKRFKLSSQRNRIQRCLRAAYRLNKQRFLTGYDLVVRVQRCNDKVFCADMQNELILLGKKAKLLKSP